MHAYQVCGINDVFFMLSLCFQRDDKGFAHPERIEKLVKNYSQFVSFPIYTWQEKGYTKEVSLLLLFEYLSIKSFLVKF